MPGLNKENSKRWHKSLSSRMYYSILFKSKARNGTDTGMREDSSSSGGKEVRYTGEHRHANNSLGSELP